MKTWRKRASSSSETPELTAVKDLQVNFNVRTHKAFERCTHLVPHNFLLGVRDIVPGLAEARPDPSGQDHLPPDPFRRPKPLKAAVYQLEKITIDFDPALTEFESEFCSLVNQVGADFSISFCFQATACCYYYWKFYKSKVANCCLKILKKKIRKTIE